MISKIIAALVVTYQLIIAIPAMSEDNVPKKKTILKNTQPSAENWQPSFGKKVVRALEASALHGFTIKVEPTQTDSFNIGAMKPKKPSTDRSDGDGKGKYFVGLRYTKKF